LLARAKLRARARCFEIGFVVPWDIGIDASCRKSVHLTDRRLPGGEAIGKIVEYRLTCSAQEGARAGIKIACCIGKGVPAAEPAPGVGVYASTGYAQAGYQATTGGQLSIVEGELVYETFDDFEINDDGLDLFNMTADTCLLNYTSFDVPQAGFSVFGDVTQASTTVANLSDLSGFIDATAIVKTRTFGVKGSGVPTGTLATYADGKLTLNKPANFFPGRPLGSPGITLQTRTVSLELTAAHLNNGIVQGGLRDQVRAINGQGVAPTTSFGRDPIGGLAQVPTIVTLDLPDLSAEFATEFAPQVLPLALPKTIDLQVIG
jgi:hypothetical protein